MAKPMVPPNSPKIFTRARSSITTNPNQLIPARAPGPKTIAHRDGAEGA